MVVQQRARKDEDKAARRATILRVAARLLKQQHYHQIKMAEVARRCDLAKGTLYLYFRSKEELFLCALSQALSSWFDALAEELPKLGGAPDLGGRFGVLVATSLAQRPLLFDLLPLLHTVLEQNIDLETAASFKGMLLEKMGRLAEILEKTLPGLPAGSGRQLLLRVHALMVGIRQMADPAPVVAEVLQRPEMEPMRVDFETEYAEALGAMVRGMLTPAPR